MTHRYDERTDERIEAMVAGLLRAGVMLAGAVVLVGAALYLARYGSAAPQYAVFRGEPENLRSVQGIVSRALTGHPRGIIQLGLLILVATPVARVLVASLAYARAREYRYAILGLMVLSVLLWSSVSGR
jgi:uncharacterized membrane protein